MNNWKIGTRIGAGFGVVILIAMVREIAAASAEQGSDANQVSKAMQQLDQVIQQNASASEELSTGADELSEQAEALQGAISFFKVGGASDQSRRPAVTARKKRTRKSQTACARASLNRAMLVSTLRSVPTIREPISAIKISSFISRNFEA